MVRRTGIVVAVLLIVGGAFVVAAELVDPLGITACANAGGKYDPYTQACDLSNAHPRSGVPRSTWVIVAGTVAILVGVGLIGYVRRLR
jgi:hypothetical protein